MTERTRPCLRRLPGIGESTLRIGERHVGGEMRMRTARRRADILTVLASIPLIPARRGRKPRYREVL